MLEFYNPMNCKHNKTPMGLVEFAIDTKILVDPDLIKKNSRILAKKKSNPIAKVAFIKKAPCLSAESQP